VCIVSPILLSQNDPSTPPDQLDFEIYMREPAGYDQDRGSKSLLSSMQAEAGRKVCYSNIEVSQKNRVSF